jgi:glycine cleavage system H protein
LRIRDYEIPDDLLYTKEHEWARFLDGEVLVGITDYAAKTLNDIVYVSLPSQGQTLKQSASFGTVESIKAVSELYSPLSGSVTTINTELTTHPELVNQSPYDKGWLLRMRPSDSTEKKNLLSAKQYAELLSSIK